MSLWVVVGGQFGSEGKGKVSAYITIHERIDICVRCGGPNSGHSFVNEGGENRILRQLPTGFVSDRTRLLLPAGALIDPTILRDEMNSLSISSSRIGIDRSALIIEERDRETEQSLKLRERLSSTLCGVGSAVSRRVLRGEDVKLASDATAEHPWLADLITDVSSEVNSGLDRNKNVLIEGTQGAGLSLYHSQFYPYCTSRDTTCAGFLSETGVSPRRVTEVVVVFRTFPIRVAGAQAGPLKDEITWEQVRQESRYPFPIEERTTVTQRIRRVGRFDWDLAARAASLNFPTRIAINCLDYLDSENRTVKRWEDLTSAAKLFVSRLEEQTRTPATYLGTGPSLADIIERGATRAAFQRAG